MEYVLLIAGLSLLVHRVSNGIVDFYEEIEGKPSSRKKKKKRR